MDIHLESPIKGKKLNLPHPDCIYWETHKISTWVQEKMFRWIEMVGSEKKEKQIKAVGNNPALSSGGYSALQEFWPWAKWPHCRAQSCGESLGQDCSVGPAFPKSKHLVGTDYSRRSTKRPVTMTSQHKTHGDEVLSDVKGKEGWEKSSEYPPQSIFSWRTNGI